MKKLQKKREQYRQKIIKEFGNPLIKLLRTEELDKLRKDIKDLKRWYIHGGGVRWWRVYEDHYGNKRRLDNVAEYIGTLEYVESVTLEDVSNEPENKELAENANKLIYKISVSFVVPENETMVGEKHYENETK